jgi:hypothetical protein
VVLGHGSDPGPSRSQGRAQSGTVAAGAILQFQTDLGDRAGSFLDRLGDHGLNVVERCEHPRRIGDGARGIGEADHSHPVAARQSRGAVDSHEADTLPLDRPGNQDVDDVQAWGPEAVQPQRSRPSDGGSRPGIEHRRYQSLFACRLASDREVDARQ